MQPCICIHMKQRSGDDSPGSNVEHMVDPQHPLEVQAQADSVIVCYESLEAGVEVGGCVGKEIERTTKCFNTHETKIY